MDTCPWLRGIENELCFAVLLGHGVVMRYRHRTIRTPVCRYSQPEDQKVDNEGQNRRPNQGEDCVQEKPLQTGSEVQIGRTHAQIIRYEPCVASLTRNGDPTRDFA